MIAADALVEPAPACGPLSMHTTERPLRANSSATADPMTPAPITMTSALVAAVTGGDCRIGG